MSIDTQERNVVDVVIDMTALHTPSRHRGIGRYIRGLAGALEALAPQSDLTLAGLVRLRGRDVLDPSLRYRGRPDLETSPWQEMGHQFVRRAFMGTTVRRTGARLFHLADAHGTPIDQRTPRLTTCQDLIPLVLHELYAPGPGGRQWQRARAWARYGTASHVVASSHSTKRDLVEHLGLDESKIDVVHLGIDHERFHARVEPEERRRVTELLGFASPFALYVGAADARKNVPLLVEAYAKSGVAPDMPLVIAGPISKRQRAHLEDVMRRCHLTEVHFCGFVPDDMIPPLYRTCSLHVFPSSYEGFGFPVLEAMACGAPTISSRASSLAEVAADAALTPDALDAKSLAEAIHGLAESEELRANLRRRGIAHASAFTWQRCGEQMMQLYARVLDA